MVHHYAGCGICEICAMGYEQLCPHGHVTYGGGTGHGANADYILVPSRTLVHLSDELSFEEGAAISCGTGTAWNAYSLADRTAGGQGISWREAGKSVLALILVGVPVTLGVQLLYPSDHWRGPPFTKRMFYKS